jgi:hypothetical protein
VSGAELNRVRDYIKNQEVHHRAKTFAGEYRDFLRKNGLGENAW